MSPWPGYFAAGLSGSALLLAFWQLPESKTAESGSARRGLLDLEGLRVALSTPSIGLLLLTSFIVVGALAAFESTLSLEIKALHDRRWLDPSHQTPCRRSSTGPSGLGYTEEADVRHVVILGTFAYLGFVMTVAQGFLVRRIAGRVSEQSMAISGTLVSTLSLILLSVAVQQRQLSACSVWRWPSSWSDWRLSLRPSSRSSRAARVPFSKVMCWA